MAGPGGTEDSEKGWSVETAGLSFGSVPVGKQGYDVLFRDHHGQYILTVKTNKTRMSLLLRLDNATAVAYIMTWEEPYSERCRQLSMEWSP